MSETGNASYTHWELLKSDFRRYEAPYLRRTGRDRAGVRGWLVRVYLVLRLQGIWASFDYRFGNWVRTTGPAALKPLSVIIHSLTEILSGISISPRAQIGAGLYIGHFGNIFVAAGTTVGAGCNISQGVTLGTGIGSVGRGTPTIGDRVFIAPGAKVFGPVEVGSGAIIGANAVVTRDVPENAVVGGIPAKVIRILDEEERARGGYASVGLRDGDPDGSV